MLSQSRSYPGRTRHSGLPCGRCESSLANTRSLHTTCVPYSPAVCPLSGSRTCWRCASPSIFRPAGECLRIALPSREGFDAGAVFIGLRLSIITPQRIATETIRHTSGQRGGPFINRAGRRGVELYILLPVTVNFQQIAGMDRKRLPRLLYATSSMSRYRGFGARRILHCRTDVRAGRACSTGQCHWTALVQYRLRGGCCGFASETAGARLPLAHAKLHACANRYSEHTPAAYAFRQLSTPGQPC